jgi:hypothetical protein
MSRLTKRTVEATAPSQRDVFVWDDALPGFGLRVLPSKGRTRRLALEPHGVLTPEQARRLASEKLAEVRHGGDPSAERIAARHAPTMADLCERYLTEYAAGRKKARSVAEDRRIIAKPLVPALGRRRIADVEHSEVVRLHNAMRKTPIMANRVLALLSKMFSLAERWRVRPLGSNPCRGIDRFPERARECFLSEAELAKLGEVLGEVERARLESPDALRGSSPSQKSACEQRQAGTEHGTTHPRRTLGLCSRGRRREVG